MSEYAYTPEEACDYYAAASPEERAEIDRLISGPPSIESIESGWRRWLKAVAPRTFTGSFASFHVELWDWYWQITQRRKSGQPLAEEELVFLALWFRGGGKSSHLEWACLAEGALVGKGYVLYVSGTQALAEGHVGSIRERLESEEILRYYPRLGSPKIGAHGNQHGWRQDFLSTSGGWAVRPLGLEVGVRGGRLGEMRPSMIILDDVDDHDDSPAVVQRKLDTIARSILPAGTSETIVLGGQNLIHRNSVFNQVYTRRTSVLSRRIISGPFAAFKDPVIEITATDQGPRNILLSGTPTWADTDRVACQKFLDDSGKEAWQAEYQHDFAATEQGRVIPEYDESLHLISWSDFASVYKVRYVPSHWRVDIGHDVGFTREHLSAWTWIATSALNSELPGKCFRYRGRTFVTTSVDDQAEAVIKDMNPDETVGREHDEFDQVQRWLMSHEALSERLSYRAKHGMPFLACDSAKTAGISQWRHLLRPDRKVRHPFKEDALLENGLWRLGCPSLFDVVADDQLVTPLDDKGLKLHREQTIAWQWRPTPLTDSGYTVPQPTKAFEDTADATRMCLSRWGPLAEPLTTEEKIEEATPEEYRYDALLAKSPYEHGLTPQQEMAYVFQRGQAKKRIKVPFKRFGDDD